MAILKKEYEISVWDEALAENGQKTEKKRAIIGAHDMNYPGRATSIKFSKKLNGTSTLTFQMPSKFFDSKVGDYVYNEFCSNIFNERKIKLKYDGKWYEYYVKDISENKQFKSTMYQYTCQDAFIDELSRNGYGITFDAELYNNVEEIGIFTNEILKDSIWYYDAKYNWGDFTEYTEEKLFKIPVSQFNSLKGYKLSYQVEGTIKNAFNTKNRKQEMGDDKSREDGFFWDGQTEDGIMYPLLKGNPESIGNDGYIYVPYSQLSFCYVGIPKKDEEAYAATETARIVQISSKGTTLKSYALAPASIDPNSLIQFIAIPKNAELQIDEAGLLVNKEYSYVMTLAEWNKSVNTGAWYHVEAKVLGGVQEIDSPGVLTPSNFRPDINAHDANKVVCYEGYLDSINNVPLTFGKKISITDRTEINISEEIDQYVKVYNNRSQEYKNYYTNNNWKDTTDNYRVCSYEATRTIVPQLARNLVQNGTNITDISGWQIMATPTDMESVSSKMSVIIEKQNEKSVSSGALMLFPCAKSESTTSSYYSFLNFGIIGQKETISQNQVYYFCLKNIEKSQLAIDKEEINVLQEINNCEIIIGDGRIGMNGDYEFIDLKECLIIEWKKGSKGIFIKPNKDFKNPYFAIRLSRNENAAFFLKEVIFSKAYTKGIDFFKENGLYKYTGRDIMFDKNSGLWNMKNNYYYRTAKDGEFLLETDVVDGDVYGYQKYFIQQINTRDEQISKDTFKLKSYLNNDYENFALEPAIYTEEDYEIETNYIDLNKCNYYNSLSPKDAADCSHPKSNGLCLFQKYGYCPYLFQTEKHCRKIRTLNGEKSNRFNLTQELSKIFEMYPVYYTEHFENGKIKTEEKKTEDGKTYDRMIKKVFYITEKGMENKIGFRYEKNLSNITKTLNSNEIVTKLYVEDVDSDLSKTGLCSIKTAEDNPSRDNFIIDFSYYTKKGLLDKTKTDYDLYGRNEEDMGYLKKLGYYNKQYDEISNKIVALQDHSYTELASNIEVNLAGISTSQQEINKINKRLSQYTKTDKDSKDESDAYKSYKVQLEEQENILYGLIESTFFTDGEGYCYVKTKDEKTNKEKWLQYTNVIINKARDFLLAINTGYVGMNRVGGFSSFEEFKEEYLDKFDYNGKGMMGQYIAEYRQIKKWKKQRANILKEINKISLAFFKKYEPFLKEGTWSDSNYLSDNSYYFGAKEVAKQGSIPKVNYNISVIDLAARGGEDEIYKVEIADTTYIEDEEIFGINEKTGFPVRLKVIISGITYDLDIPSQNSIEIQNYTTQFEDLFEQVTASVQSLSFNENIYKRSSNFTATKNVEGESLQGALDENQITLVKTEEDNLHLDQTGQSGSDINNHNNKYKLDGQGLFFSNNGGQTWNVGVTPKGINADYIKVGSLDASKVSIVDGDYLYFLWDKSGITAYRTPQATAGAIGEKVYLQDFARFNKYGLSLVENGKIRLRAGYDYHQTNEADDTRGDINKENEIAVDSALGFYLYDSKGNKIFATETESSLGETDESKKKIWEEESARIALAGEIYTTDKINVESTSNLVTRVSYKYGSSSGKKLLQFVRTRAYQLGGAYENSNGVCSSISQAVAKYLKNNTSNIETYTISPASTSETSYKIYLKKGSRAPSISDLKEQGSGYKIKGTGYEPFYKTIINVSMKISYDVDNNDSDTDKNNKLQDTTVEIITYSLKKKSALNGNLLELWDNNTNTFFEATEKDSFYLLSKEVNGGRTTTLLLPYTTIKYYKKNSNGEVVPANDKTSYYFDSINLFAYVTKEEIVTNNATNQTLVEGKTEMYINNKKRGTPEAALVADQGPRLFCCVRRGSSAEEGEEKTNQIQNIFTILKNGELHIGGLIENIDGGQPIKQEDSLPTDIKITDSGIKIQGGNLFMDLSKFKDMDTKEDILNIINRTVEGASVGRHAHEIKNITLKIKDKPTKYNILPTKETAKSWKDAIFQTGNGNDNNENAKKSYVNECFNKLIELFVGNTVNLATGSGKYNPDSAANNIIPNFDTQTSFDTINSRTEYSGNGSNEQTSTYVYEDPVAE